MEGAPEIQFAEAGEGNEGRQECAAASDVDVVFTALMRGSWGLRVGWISFLLSGDLLDN
jgi:hypothetical protein